MSDIKLQLKIISIIMALQCRSLNDNRGKIKRITAFYVSIDNAIVIANKGRYYQINHI